MKILVTTRKTQGWRANDFCHNVGEFAAMPMECDCPGGADGTCGCKRSYAGCDSQSGCTTVEVVEADVSEEDCRKSLIKFWRGWPPSDALDEMIKTDLAILLGVARDNEVGEVIEKRGNIHQPRSFVLGTKRPKCPRCGATVDRDTKICVKECPIKYQAESQFGIKYLHATNKDKTHSLFFEASPPEQYEWCFMIDAGGEVEHLSYRSKNNQGNDDAYCTGSPNEEAIREVIEEYASKWRTAQIDEEEQTHLKLQYDTIDENRLNELEAKGHGCSQAENEELQILLDRFYQQTGASSLKED